MSLLWVHRALFMLAIAIPGLFLPAWAQAAPVLEVFEPTGENPFARNIYFCPECTPAQFEQIQVPPGFEASSSSRENVIEAEVLSLTVPPGVAPSLDLSLDIPGDDFFYVARLLDASILEFDPVLGLSILAQVERDTVFTYEAGMRIHEATDPQGNLYVLFGIDTTSGIDPTQPDAFAGVPLPAGWSVSDRVLSSELSVASGGVATVFTTSSGANFQQYAVVPEPSTSTLLGLGLAAIASYRRPKRSFPRTRSVRELHRTKGHPTLSGTLAPVSMLLLLLLPLLPTPSLASAGAGCATPESASFVRPFDVALEDYPFQSCAFRTAVGDIHFFDEGPRDASETILMVHGNPTWSFLYRNIAKAMIEDGHRVVVLDHLGMGMSDVPSTTEFDYRPRSHADHLEDLVVALDLRNVTLVVQDWGGPIGLGMATRQHDRISRILIMNTWSWSVDAQQPGDFHELVAWTNRAKSLARVIPTFFCDFALPGQSMLNAAEADPSRGELYQRVLSAYLSPAIDGTTGGYRTSEPCAPMQIFAESIGDDDAFQGEVEQRMGSLVGKPYSLLFGLSDPLFGALRCNTAIDPPCPGRSTCACDEDLLPARVEGGCSDPASTEFHVCKEPDGSIIEPYADRFEELLGRESLVSREAVRDADHMIQEWAPEGVIQALRRLLAVGENEEPIPTPRKLDLTGGRLAWFVDRDGTERDAAIVKFVGEAEIVAPLPDPTVVSSTIRIFSDTADTADGGITFLDRSNWTRRGDGFVYNAHPATGPAPGGIVRILFKPGRNGGSLMIWARGGGYGANSIHGPVDYVQVAFGVGPITYVGRFQAPPARVRSNSAEKVLLSGRNASVPSPPGHELVDLSTFPNLVVWGTQGLTTEQYDAIELPPGWLRNQPRAGAGALGRFLRSPGLGADGEFRRQEMFGMTWLHQATVTGFGDSPDEEGLLRVTFIDKHHELSWRAGSSIRLLTSPDGEDYVLVSRDDRRTSETSTIPNGWSVTDIYLEEDLQIELPRPTVNIRTDNEDSFQGPLPSDLGF